jgi:hypothetical protein
VYYAFTHRHEYDENVLPEMGMNYDSCKNMSIEQREQMFNSMMEKMNCMDSTKMKTCCEKMGMDYENCKNMTPKQRMEMCSSMMKNMNCADSTMKKECMKNMKKSE